MTPAEWIIIGQWAAIAVLVWGWAREHAQHRELKRLVDKTTATILDVEPLGRTPHSDPRTESFEMAIEDAKAFGRGVVFVDRYGHCHAVRGMGGEGDPIEEAAKAGYRVGDDHES